jgi:membrane-bound lytic murein transglycosylase D
MLIKAGSTLLVPRTAKRDHDVSEHLADSAQLALTPEQRLVKRVVKARKGDTLAAIARRQRLPLEQLVEWNGGRSASAVLKTGQPVTLMLRAPAAKASAKAQRGSRPAAASATKGKRPASKKA